MKIRARLSISADGYVTTPGGWPALNNDRWPWPSLDVFVLASSRPEGMPDDVVVDADPAALLERLRAANRGGDVHLVGGPRTIETFRALGALDELQLVVLPLLLGGGMRLTEGLSPEAGLTFVRSRPLDGGAVEIVYAVDAAAAAVPGRDAGWAPASQR